MAEKMKRILIFSHALELGGAEKALLGLLDVIDKTEYRVDLFLMRHQGELMPYIPEGVRLLPEIPRYACLAVPIGNVIRKGQLGVAFGRWRGKTAAKKRREQLDLPADNDVALQYSHKFTLPYMPELPGEYDAAISFLTPHYFVAEKVRAKKKIAWIHTDYSAVAVDREEQLSMWARFDRIIAISDTVRESFERLFPELTEKTVMISHALPVKYMKRKADEFSAEGEMPADGSLRLLSVGRFCCAKNFDSVPEICRQIRAGGLNVKWYLIGYGPDEALIRQRITEAGMEDHVRILGKKENPYPYIKACDLYVQPSRYEGKCVSVLEAQILARPTVITAYPTSAGQLEDGVDGAVVPLNSRECANAIAALLRDRDKMGLLSRNCANRDYSGAEEIEKLYDLIG